MLESIKAHLARLKMIVRAVGLGFAAVGGGMFFSSLTRVLVFIPLVGPLLNRISGWIGMIIGFLLGLITLVLTFLTSQPLILALLGVVLAAAFFFFAKNATRKRERLQGQLQKSLGYAPSQNELEELEFIKLWQLMSSDGEISTKEQKRLDKWTKQHRWNSEKIPELTERAQAELSSTTPRENLRSLIHFTLADGHLDRSEMKSLERAAMQIGVPKLELNSLIAQAQRV